MVLQGFKKFILRGNVIDLAVGVIIGSAFNGVVNSIVRDLLTPLIGIFAKKADFSDWKIQAGYSSIRIGDLINNIISFLLIATAAYFLVILPMNAFLARTKKDQPPTVKKCPECLSEIPVNAKRCAHCGQLIK